MPIPFLEFDFITIITTIFWVWMLVDCLFNKRVKVIWLIFIFFTHWIGALIYYFIECSHRNPLEALSYYVQYINGLFQQKPPSTQHMHPQPPPNYYAHTDYQQGYQAQQPRPAVVQPEEAPVYRPEPEYEQPTATYPEMPTQQQ